MVFQDAGCTTEIKVGVMINAVKGKNNKYCQIYEVYHCVYRYFRAFVVKIHCKDLRATHMGVYNL